MTIVERAELERNELKLRQISQELLPYAPAVALKVSAIAAEILLKIAVADRLTR